MGTYKLPETWVKLFQATGSGRFWKRECDPQAGAPEPKRKRKQRKRRRAQARRSRRANR